MAEKRDYYEVLGVNKNSTPDEIKSAYRKAALKWHPDKWVNGTDAEKKTAEDNFKEASEAYSVLSDENKKARYDRYGFAGMDGGSASGGSGFGGFGDFDLNDILNSVFGRGFDFGGGGFSGFSSFGGGGSRGGTMKQRGSNLLATEADLKMVRQKPVPPAMVAVKWCRPSTASSDKCRPLRCVLPAMAAAPSSKRNVHIAVAKAS